MERRTRKLTSREAEVLDLVRLGLTNDEIAERLAITSDGVKYHVSQILAKLGVSSRHEAVAVVYGKTRKPWSVGFAWTILRAAGAVAAVAAVGFVALVLWGVLSSNESTEPPDVTGLTAEEVYGSIRQAATRPGHVLQSQIEASLQTANGGSTPAFTLELWIDAERETLRSEYRLAPEQDAYDRATEATSIVIGEYVYVTDNPGEALRHGFDNVAGVDTPPWMSILLFFGAGVIPETQPILGEPRIESGEYQGHGSVVLVFESSEVVPVPDPNAPLATPPSLLTGPTPLPTSVVATETPGAIQTITTTWRVYIDAADYLPLAVTVTRGTDGGPTTGGAEAVYENEFIPLNDEIEALLDPASIGYGAEDAEALLDEIEAETPVYWLGEEFQGDGLGELVLERIIPGGQIGGVEQIYRVGGQLVYQAPDGSPEVRLFLWPRDEWQAFLTTREGRILTDPSCAQAHESQTGGLPMTVFILPPIDFPGSAQQAPGESDCNFERRQVALVDRVMGVIGFDDVAVQVRQAGYAESLSDMQSLLQRLRPR